MPNFKHSGEASFPYAVTGFPACGRSITPSDATDLLSLKDGVTAIPMHVVVFGAGTITVIPAGNSDANTLQFTVSATAADVGFTVPVLVRRVMATGTAATGIFGFY